MLVISIVWSEIEYPSVAIGSSEDSNCVTTEASAAAEEVEFAESSLKERLGKAIELDIRSGNFSWDSLLTVCRTEHMKSSAGEEDEKSLAIEVLPLCPVLSLNLVFLTNFLSCGSHCCCPSS